VKNKDFPVTCEHKRFTSESASLKNRAEKRVFHLIWFDCESAARFVNANKQEEELVDSVIFVNNNVTQIWQWVLNNRFNYLK